MFRRNNIRVWLFFQVAAVLSCPSAGKKGKIKNKKQPAKALSYIFTITSSGASRVLFEKPPVFRIWVNNITMSMPNIKIMFTAYWHIFNESVIGINMSREQILCIETSHVINFLFNVILESLFQLKRFLVHRYT